MCSYRRKDGLCAKEPLDIRPSSAMRSIGVAVVWFLLVPVSCFNPQEDCRITCQMPSDCPNGLTCVASPNGKLCVHSGQSCGSRDATMESVGAAADAVDGAHADAIDGAYIDAIDGAYIDAIDGARADAPIDRARADAPIDVAYADASVDVPSDSRDAPNGADLSGPTDMNASPDTHVDAVAEMGPDVEAGEVSLDGNSSDAALDGGPDGSEGGCPPGRTTSPPTTVCQGGHCLTLSTAVRSGLVLWLDPSNLGAVGTSVSTWCDQSGQMNDAFEASDAEALPQVMPAGILLPYGSSSVGFIVANSSSIDLAADDFLILVVGSIQHDTESKSFFQKSDNAFDTPKQVELEWLGGQPDGGFRLTGYVNETSAVSNVATDVGPARLYGLRRARVQVDGQPVDQVEVRVNGQVVSTQPLGTQGASTENDSDVYIGEFGIDDATSVDTLSAVVVVRGTLDSSEVATLESYFIDAFGLL